MTANYLLDTIHADSPTDAAPYAVPDLSGGSTQIVFEAENAESEEYHLRTGSTSPSWFLADRRGRSIGIRISSTV